MSDTMGKVLMFRIPGAGRVAKCERCGAPCKVADKTNRAAQLLKYAEEPVGYCVTCAALEFLWTHNCLVICPDIEGFRLPHMQAQFAAVMRAGMADARPNEIDWNRLVDQYHLPFKVGRKMISPKDHPEPPPIPRARKPKPRAK